MAESSDTGARFGTAAIKLGVATAAQVRECLQIQQKMTEMGMEETLGDILLKKGYITGVQRSQVLKSLGIQISPIPGYEIVSRLGQGAMGTVFKARHLKMNRTVAVKVISPEHAQDANFVERFFREARAAAQLSHPNIISAYDVVDAGGHCCFVMEYVEGITLARALEKYGRLKPKRAAEIMVTMAEALGYIAENHMVHRDVKPENIMMTREGDVKLCDFGLAKSMKQEEVSLTLTGWTLGTPTYMSPEQIRGLKDIDARCDIYSLGATIYHALAGRPPFEAESAGAMLSLHLEETPKPVRVHSPQVPSDLDSIVLRCLEKERENRYPTAAELTGDLKRFLSGRKISGKKPTVRKEAEPPPRKLRLPVLAGSAVAAAVFLLILVLAVTSGGNPAESGDGNGETGEPPGATSEDLEAGVKLETAKKAFENARWDEALPLFEDLLENHKEARPVLDGADEIPQYIAICRDKIETRREKFRKKLEDAKARLALAEWEPAQLILEGLGNDPEVLKLLKSCRMEIECGEALDLAQRQFGEGRWAEARDAYTAIGSRFRGTETLASHASEVELNLGSSLSEIQAVSALETLLGLGEEKRWESFLSGARAIEAKFGATRSLRERAGEIRVLRKEALRALAERAQRQADELWRRAMAETDPVKALALFEQYRREYSDAEWFPGIQRELEMQIGERRRQIDMRREDVAGEILSRAEKAFRSRKYAEASELFKSLLNDFRDTDVVARSEAGIREKLDVCWEKLGPGVLVRGMVFDDFEKGVQRWNPSVEESSLKGNPTKVETAPRTGRNGSNALRVIYPAGVSEWKMHHAYQGVETKVKGLHDDLGAFRFWGRSEKGGEMTLFFTLIETHKMQRGQVQLRKWRSKIQLTDEWRLYTVHVSDLKPARELKKGARPDHRRVERLGFFRCDYEAEFGEKDMKYYTDNDPKKEFRILIDDIVLQEKGRK